MTFIGKDGCNFLGFFGAFLAYWGLVPTGWFRGF